MRNTSLLLLTLACALNGCAPADTTPSTPPSSQAVSQPAKAFELALNAKPDPATDPAGIHNLMKVSDTIYSGSEPHGEEGFASLEKLGVKTVVSVDGAKPNLEAAHKHGMRYVHIPIGYDGVPADAALALARVVKDQNVPRPIYIHCHHGKHRGPSAAAVACVAAGSMTNQDALGILQRAGTSKDYTGLWRDVEKFTPPAADAKLPELVEVAQVGDFTAAMSQVDRGFDNVKLFYAAKWQPLADHPDLVGAQEALLVQEGLHEAARNLSDGYDDQFKAWLNESDTMAAALRDDLQKKDFDAANQRYVQLEAACKQCHKKYRDQ